MIGRRPLPAILVAPIVAKASAETRLSVTNMGGNAGTVDLSAWLIEIELPSVIHEDHDRWSDFIARFRQDDDSPLNSLLTRQVIQQLRHNRGAVGRYKFSATVTRNGSVFNMTGMYVQAAYYTQADVRLVMPVERVALS